MFAGSIIYIDLISLDIALSGGGVAGTVQCSKDFLYTSEFRLEPSEPVADPDPRPGTVSICLRGRALERCAVACPAASASATLPQCESLGALCCTVDLKGLAVTAINGCYFCRCTMVAMS